MQKHVLLFIGLLLTTSILFAQKQAPGLDVLGYGYDVFGNYADQRSKKRYCLFKYSDFTTTPIGSQQYSVPQYVILENISNHITKTVKGSSLREYAKSQSASVGLGVDAMFFAASVSTAFSSSSSGSVRHFYYTYRDANTKWRISFDERSMSQLVNMLDPLFIQDLNNPELSAKELFDRYGTHYIASAYLGGRADFNSKSVITRETNTSKIAVAVEAKYQAVSANVSLSKEQSQTLSNSKTTTKLTVTGGNSEFANNIQDPVKYEQWASGIADMPVLCDFDKNSLKPIWMFCEDASRKAKLKAEFERMKKANPLPKAMAASMQASNQVVFIKNLGYENMYIDIPGYHFDADRVIRSKVNTFPKDLKYGGLQGIDRFIKVIPHATETDYVFLQPQHSDLVLDVSGGSKEPGTGIALWNQGNNNSAQMFKLIEVDGKKRTYYIENKKSGLVLTAHGMSKQITQEKNTKAESQQWSFETASASDMAPMIHDVAFAVRNVKAKRYMDLGGKGNDAKTKDTHVKLWDMDYYPDRYITLKKSNLDGYFYVHHNHSSKYYWDMEGGKKDNGTKLQLWDKNNSEAQQFKFIYAGSAMTFFIENRGSGKYLDASDSQIDKNGCPIGLWTPNKGENQQWKLEPAGPKWYAPERKKVKIRVAYSDKTWDLSGGEEKAKQKGSQLQIWTDEDAIDRYFVIKKSNDHSWVWIELHGGMRLDVKGSKVKEKGALLHTWSRHGGDSQKFAIHPTGRETCIIYSKGWKTFDVRGGDIKDNGPDIILWDKHLKGSQQFKLIDAETGKPIRFDKAF